ncbi:MAG: TadE/TadG family type IV pilus assembly protein [Duganella sp.]
MKVSTFLRRRQRGSAVVEMAIIAPMAFLLLIGIIEFSIVFYTTLTMQFAIREGARYAITGRSDKDPATANQQRYLAVVQQIKNNSMGMYDSVNPVISVNGATYASSTAYSANMFGSPGEIVVLRIDCTWKIATPIVAALFPNGQYKFTVATTMMNESFPGG